MEEGKLLAQRPCSAIELSRILNQGEEQNLRGWLGNLLDYGLIEKSGEGKGTQYCVNAKFTRLINPVNTTVKKKVILSQLEKLIYKKVKAHQGCSFGEIRKLIGEEINQYKLRRILKEMIDRKVLKTEGVNKGMKYFIEQNHVRKHMKIQ